MSVTVVETYTCDGCGATVQRSTGEPLPETWCFLGYVNEPHDEGSLLLCSLCVRGIGFADALKAINDKHHEHNDGFSHEMELILIH